MSSDALYELMKSRRSVRCFARRPVPREIIEKLLGAAITAPSASNKQPWRFWVLEDPDMIARLAQSVRDAAEKIERCVSPESKDAFAIYGDYFSRFENAPVVIVPLHRKMTLLSHLTGDGLDAEQKRSIDLMERDSALVSISLAVQNLLLMATKLGVGASVMTGPLIAGDSLRLTIGFKSSWEPLGVIPLGYTADEPEMTRRKDIAKVVRFVTPKE